MLDIPESEYAAQLRAMKARLRLLDEYQACNEQIRNMVVSAEKTDKLIADLGMKVREAKALANKLYFLRHAN